MQPAKSSFSGIFIGLNFILCFTISCKKNQDVPKIQDWAQSQTTDFNGKGRQNAVTFSFGSKGYAGLGNQDENTAFTDLWEFNPADKSWTKKADFPGTARLAPSGFYIGNRGYVVNGLCDCNDFWEYDPANDKWTSRASFPVSGVYYTATFVVNGKGYVGTGLLNGNMINDFWEYDPGLDQWSKKANYPGPSVDAAAGFAIGNKGYFVGGNLPLGLSNSLWEYDPVTDKWTQKMDCPFSAFSPVAFTMNDKGYVGLGFGGSTQFWSYTPGTDSWMKSVDFIGGYREGAKAFVIGNTAYIGLGSSTYTVYRTDFWTLSGN
jgi:N-acetylneuraminic acid mutarotase